MLDMETNISTANDLCTEEACFQSLTYLWIIHICLYNLQLHVYKIPYVNMRQILNKEPKLSLIIIAGCVKEKEKISDLS